MSLNNIANSCKQFWLSFVSVQPRWIQKVPLPKGLLQLPSKPFVCRLISKKLLMKSTWAGTRRAQQQDEQPWQLSRLSMLTSAGSDLQATDLIRCRWWPRAGLSNLFVILYSLMAPISFQRQRQGRIIVPDSRSSGATAPPAGSFPWLASLFLRLEIKGEKQLKSWWICTSCHVELLTYRPRWHICFPGGPQGKHTSCAQPPWSHPRWLLLRNNIVGTKYVFSFFQGACLCSTLLQWKLGG